MRKDTRQTKNASKGFQAATGEDWMVTKDVRGYEEE